MTSTTQNKGRITKTSTREKSISARSPDTKPALPGVRRLPASGTAARGSVSSMRQPMATATLRESQNTSAGKINGQSSQSRTTAIEECVQHELRRYFDMLDGEEPSNLYRMVVRQVEHALIDMVMQECRGNQTRASEWLGISRGNLRTKLSNMDNQGNLNDR